MEILLLTEFVPCGVPHFTVKPRLHQDTCCRTQVVSTCCRQRVSCVGDKNVASLSPVCCWIQRDTSRPWHKWIVIMSPRYSQHVSHTSNIYPATLCPSTYMYPDTSCSSGIHVAGQHVSWCKCGFTVTKQSSRQKFKPLFIFCAKIQRYKTFKVFILVSSVFADTCPQFLTKSYDSWHIVCIQRLLNGVILEWLRC